MPAKDLDHDNCKQALVKDGWKITHDPYPMRWGKKDLFVDLGAEKFLGAEKGDRRIAIEVKSFVGLSDIQDLKNALGQFILYQDLLVKIEPERELFLAIRDVVFSDLFEDSMSIGKVLLENRRFKLLVFNSEQEVIVSWMS
ncbi:element excision factor XisH family protein [Roseofilum capinflatum]|uniref:Element excision factor XisH family protein n=1 Tax=Roseofilum capinflatum BLCC-M114 TaxID=3022440 RepID=A0ABT7B0T8_9CYAN|nr:element excision factor XisH family protein [Roseofilum capinflatum]MDJ1172788.1 element excision factor XisH family protein [Roseofilum capinflatum BLCC-M114]